MGDTYDVAAEFHSLWNKGKDDATLRFVVQDKNHTLARLQVNKVDSVCYR